MLSRVPPSAINQWLDQTSQSLKTSQGVAKFRSLVRKGAQQVSHAVEGVTRSSSVGLGNLAQSIANAATDKSELETATEMGRESLRLSKEAGNSLGMADALRQLARTKWLAGERLMAVNMQAAALEIYRTQQPEVAPIAERELAMYETQLREAGEVSLVRVSVDTAVNMALKENPSMP
jgi:hypothetical protein